MPEMHFNLKWPDGSVDRCYSPSWVIEEHLEVGAEYELEEFVLRAATALELASERVRAKYGFACSSALDQLGALRTKAEHLSAAEQPGKVRVLSFEKHAPREAKAKAAT